MKEKISPRIKVFINTSKKGKPYYIVSFYNESWGQYHQFVCFEKPELSFTESKPQDDK